jgi:pantoate--beta-alanine ligase
MQVVTEIGEYRKLRGGMAAPVGFVPTMGYLHQGHLELVRRARAENKAVVASIFVNPTQFGPQEDYQRYPRDPDRDLALLRQEGADVVFMPPVEEMYPEGFSSYVEVSGVTEVLEGVHRPTHFRGVTTVVAKLFVIVQPDRAYFGRKDAQQLVVVRKMARDLDLGVDVLGLPTLREPDGLAMSSRNAYLSPRERQAALVLSRSLRLAEELWGKGERHATVIRQRMNDLIAAEPLARVDYVSVADAESLRELDKVEGPALVSLAVRVGRTRLIDNVTLGGPGDGDP